VTKGNFMMANPDFSRVSFSERHVPVADAYSSIGGMAVQPSSVKFRDMVTEL
jgi:hypothetical protein